MYLRVIKQKVGIFLPVFPWKPMLGSPLNLYWKLYLIYTMNRPGVVALWLSTDGEVFEAGYVSVQREALLKHYFI